MRKTTKAIMLVSLSVSLLVGGSVTGYLFGVSEGTKSAQSTNNKTSTDTPNNTSQGKDVKGVNDMTSIELYEKLQSTPSSDKFNETYINSLLSLRNNETGMSRIAIDKATKPELKQLAQDQMDASSQLVADLYKWQKLWGYTDH